MSSHDGTPTDPYSRPQPKPHRYSRPRPSLARYVLAVATVAVIGALALWGGLAAQMSSGGDPVLGVAAASNPSTSAPVSDDDGEEIDDDGDDDGEEIDDDDLEEGDLGAVVIGGTVSEPAATTTTAPVPAPAPVQTSTS